MRFSFCHRVDWPLSKVIFWSFYRFNHHCVRLLNLEDTKVVLWGNSTHNQADGHSIPLVVAALFLLIIVFTKSLRPCDLKSATRVCVCVCDRGL